jgi:hypothetical protein
MRKESSANGVVHRATPRIGVVAGGHGGNAFARRARHDPVALSKAIIPINDGVASADDLQLIVANNGAKQALTLRAFAVGLRAVLVGKGAVAIARAGWPRVTFTGDDDVLRRAAGR